MRTIETKLGDVKGLPSEREKPGQVVVTTLVGETGVPLALQCIESWNRCVPFDELLVYEDGTLSDVSRAQIAELSPRIRIVRKREADEKFLESFDRGRFPRLAKLRDHFPLGRKILDIPAFSREWINYIDSDVYFYRPVEVLWRQQAGGTGVWMMKDFQNIYSARGWQLLPKCGVPLPQKANSGLISCRTECYDPEFLESILRRHFSSESSWTWVIEQTLWAALGWRSGLEFYDPGLIGLATAENRANIYQMAALHWAGLFRSYFVPLTHRETCLRESQNCKPIVSLNFEPASRLTWSHVVARRIQFEITHNVKRLLPLGRGVRL